ncbi:MBL fold metallo-hydrolase [Bacillus chungangensis]|uniref:Beta-lactamase superfamily II metal-dependent hydrolase n=1 Tax=Bacillus chungangensis TaxID=587633 RepID=A0ABT9WRN5_9BACI|nr:MBL fold metallo-hydrolase [Bacillus chungangensis]MDQ0175960.1 beta-lactamase superfamily II metal-dependent hydrolase [Bacillus chungangensis]
MTRRLLSLFIAFTIFLLVGCDGAIDTSSVQDEKQTNESEKQVEEKADINLESLKVHYIDVGQADATLFEFQHKGENFNLLIDTGNFNSSNALDYLLDHGVDHIDAVMITHPHADHVGQLDKIIENITVDEVWMSGYTITSQTFERAMEAALNSNATYHEPRVGEVYDVGPLAIEILNPAKIEGSIHENCLAVRLTYGDVAFIVPAKAINMGIRIKEEVFF